MPREALLARLVDARRQRCVVIQGPAGCAKTSTLLAWRQALLALDFDVAWVSLAPEHDDLASFFQSLLGSLADVDPALVREAGILMGRDGGSAAAEHWVITLVRAIAARGRELVLMFDDVHLLSDPAVLAGLRWLLDYAPPQLHVVLASRTAPPLSLSRLRAQGLVTGFGLADLRFSAQESARFLREHVGDIDANATGQLHALTGGWAAGLQLFAIDLRAKALRGGAYVPVAVRDADTFASYFEREVLAGLAPDDMHLLTRMALGQRTCAALCAALLGRPEAEAGLAATLARMERDDLFLTQVGGDDTWYRLHPMLREVLLAKLGELPAAERVALHEAAWHWFRARGLLEEAVGHAVEAGDAQAAADIVQGCAQDLLARGELGQLSALMRRLPATQVQGSFDLLMVRAYLHMYAGEADAVSDCLARMEATGRPLGAGERYALAVLRGGLALSRDDTDAVVALLPELHRIPPGADDFTLTARGNILSWMYIYRGEYERAREVLEAGSPGGNGPGASRAPRGILLNRCMAGMTHTAEGQFLVAERIFSEVLEEASRHGQAYVGVATMAAALQGEALYELNGTGAALALLAPRIDVLERISMPDTVLRALLVMAGALQAAGRGQEAMACLDRLQRYAERRGVDRLLASALYRRCRRLLDVGDVEEAGMVALRLEGLADRYPDATRSTAWEVRVNASLAHIRLCLHRHDVAGALARLAPLTTLSEAGGRWCRVAALHMLWALAEHQRGGADAARTHLLEALRLGHRLGLVRSLLDVSPRVPTLLAALVGALVDDPAADPILSFYAQRLLDASGPTVAVGDERLHGVDISLGTPIDSLSEREAEVLRLLAQAMPNKTIARVLGVSLDTVKWHLRHVYAKLGVAGRDQAVARLRDHEARRGTA